MKGRHAEMQSVSDRTELQRGSVFVRPLNFLSRNNNVVSVVEREGRGHPGYIVRCIETGDMFLSQKEVAKAYNCPDSILSMHLRGKIPDFAGHHFERVGIAL